MKKFGEFPTPVLKQAWTVSGVLLNMFAQGMILSYPSSLLPRLQEPDSPIKVSLSTASWLASSIGISCMMGFIVSSFFMDWWGRRLAFGLVILPGIWGWLLIYFAQDVTTLMMGRIFGGITSGATVTLGAIIIGEYTSPNHRGMFLNLKTASTCMGNTAAHIIGNYFHWRDVALFSMIPLVVSLCIVCTWPESPVWLASKKRYKKSEQAFIWLRGDNERKELEEMIQIQEERTSKSIELSQRSKVMEFFQKFRRQDFLKPLFIVFLGSIVLEASGRHNFPAYAISILQEITENKTHSFYYTLVIDLIMTVSAISSSALVKVMRRRLLLFSSGIAALLVLLATCLYLYAVSIGLVTKVTWIPLSMLILYFILSNLGCTPIPYTFLGEVFPLAHREVGSAVSGIILSFNLMVVLKVTPLLLASISIYGTFTVFSVAIACGLFGLYFTLPETKDRTLQEIEDYFNNGKFKK